MAYGQSALGGVVETLMPINPDAANEIDRLLTILRGHGWSGFITADEALTVALAGADAGLVEVTVEYGDQIVGPCLVLWSFGPFLRVQMPVKGGFYQLRWVPRWRVVDACRG